MITVEELMTPDPFTLQETDSVDDAWKIMTEKHVRHIPITDADNHVLGLVTQRDVLAASEPVSIREADGSSDNVHSDTNLSDIMIKNVKVIHLSNHLRQAALYMQSHKHGCLPVVSDDKLVGIITDSDFVSIAINLIEQVELLEEQADSDDFLDDVEMPEVEEDEWN
ncbi:MAG: CBS domain-containing protein [Gammaproteobacteria bacterium]|nr:MAG: CBS domain-containing protein [Gammaproteobacteria bacterium]